MSKVICKSVHKPVTIIGELVFIQGCPWGEVSKHGPDTEQLRHGPVQGHKIHDGMDLPADDANSRRKLGLARDATSTLR